MKRLRSPSWWVVTVIWSAFAFIVLARPYWNAFAWDSFGYHLYLPGFLIKQDPLLHDRSWVEMAHEEHDVAPQLYQITERDGHRVIRYSMGVAVAWSPWFLLGHGIAGLSGQPRDGYSKPYQWSVVCGVLLYLLIGLGWLRRCLLSKFDDGVVAITLLVLLLGTNLIEQVLTNITGPHALLFTAYSGILYFTVRWHATFHVRDAVVLAVLMGLAALIRPTDLCCVLIPLLWGHGLRAAGRHWKQVLLVIGIMAVIGFPQLLYWYRATGSWFYDSYGNAGEGLDLVKPHTREFLFSFRKGWWLYTPVMLVATAGIVFLRGQWRSASVAVALFFIVNLWLVSSWTCWWYADSFGSRAMTGSYPVMCLPLCALISRAGERRIAKHAVRALLAVLTLFNLFQYRQFTRGIIHPQRMTRAAYIAVFGRNTKPLGLDKLLLVDRNSARPDPSTHRRSALPDGLFTGPAIDPDTLIPGDEGPIHALRLDKDHPFTPAIRIPFDRLTAQDHVWVESEWQVLLRDGTGSPALSIVRTFEHGGRSYSYSTEDVDLSGASRGQWRTVKTFYLSPEVRDRQDSFVTYAWLRDTVPLFIVGPSLHLHQPVATP